MFGITEWFAGLFATEDEDPTGFEQLKAALTPEPEGVVLTGTFTVPTIDTQAANTAVFPVVLEDHNGEHYGITTLEFDVPRDGDIEGTELGLFLEDHGIESAEDLELIVGQDARVERVGGVIQVY